MNNDDATICPLCHGPNDCALAAGHKQCWCFEVEVSYDARTRALELAGEGRCLCRRCAVPPSPAERLEEANALLRKR